MATETQRWADTETLARLADYPCFRCLSDQQLLLVLGILLCRILSTDPDNECTVPELLEHATCASCFSDRQIMQIVVALIAKYAVDNNRVDDVDQLIQDAVCLNCVDPKIVRAVIAEQIGRGILDDTLFNPR